MKFSCEKFLCLKPNYNYLKTREIISVVESTAIGYVLLLASNVIIPAAVVAAAAAAVVASSLIELVKAGPVIIDS